MGKTTKFDTTRMQKIDSISQVTKLKGSTSGEINYENNFSNVDVFNGRNKLLGSICWDKPTKQLWFVPQKELMKDRG